MWILSRLNQRVKGLLYSNLLQQEIQFFEDNKPGDTDTNNTCCV